MKIAIIGAGWAGLAAAIASTQAGHHATVFEASRAVGGGLEPYRIPNLGIHWITVSTSWSGRIPNVCASSDWWV